MFLSAEALRSHIGYTAWASGRLVEAAGQLTPKELTRDFGRRMRACWARWCTYLSRTGCGCPG